MFPKVSVVIPVYNHEKYIRECVESVLNQDYEELEVIVIDDGSTDSTPQILKEFGERIRYVRQENQGAAAALNNGLRLAKGSLIGWLSSDDVYLPGKIKYQVRKFQEEPALALVYTDYIMIDADGRELREVRSPCPSPDCFIRELLDVNFIFGSSVLVRKECFEKIGYFNEKLKACVDADMWFRLLKNGYRFGHVSRVLLKYRWHSANQSHNYKLLQSCSDKVYLTALQEFSPQELFGDLLPSGQISIDLAYERLAFALVRRFNFRSASKAMKRSMENSFSLKRGVLSTIFKIISTRAILWPLLFLRNLRIRWLYKRRYIR